MVRIRPTVIVGDYTVNSTITYQDLVDDKVELPIDQAKYFAVKCDDVDKAQSDIKIMNEVSIDAGHQTAIVIDKDVLGTVYADAGSTLTSQQVTKTNVLDWIVDAGIALDDNSAPPDGRWLVLPPWIWGIIKKSDLKDASLSGDDTSIMRNGRVGVIDRFMVHQSVNLSGSATSAVPEQCIAGTKHAIAFASQVVKTEPVRLQDTFGDAIRGLNVYGRKVVYGNALVSMPAYK